MIKLGFAGEAITFIMFALKHNVLFECFEQKIIIFHLKLVNVNVKIVVYCIGMFVTNVNVFEPPLEKTCLRVFRPDATQTGLYSQ